MRKSLFNKIVAKWRRFRASHKESYYTEEEARRIAIKNNLEKEFDEALDFGFTPDEALEEWDIYPYGETKKEVLSNCYLYLYHNMKNIIWFILIVFTAIGCSKDDSNDGGDNAETPFTLEGKWYISGSTEGYLDTDSATYRYDEKVIGYHELLIEPIHEREYNYLIKERMRYIRRHEDESDYDYTKRITEGNYTQDELYMPKEWGDNGNKWYVMNNEMYTNLWDSRIDGNILESKYLIAKIVKSSYNQFTLASMSPSILFIGWVEPPKYYYYITYTRIKE